MPLYGMEFYLGSHPFADPADYVLSQGASFVNILSWIQVAFLMQEQRYLEQTIHHQIFPR